MKITLNQETGKVEIHLQENEKYDIEEHFDALLLFLSEQAMLWFALSKRMDALENKAKIESTKIN